MAALPARRFAKRNEPADRDREPSSRLRIEAAKADAKRRARTTPAPLVSAALERRPARLVASVVALSAAALAKPQRTVGGVGRA
ncbi:MAG: hypothetical protein ACREXI_12280, partial [Caldimonas sp.]